MKKNASTVTSFYKVYKGDGKRQAPAKKRETHTVVKH